jgi:hypothetical protein
MRSDDVVDRNAGGGRDRRRGPRQNVECLGRDRAFGVVLTELIANQSHLSAVIGSIIVARRAGR